MSNEPKWTPAPWNLDVCADGAPHAIGATDPKDNMYFQLASIWGEDVDTVETDMSLANANLIAEAPALYEQLEKARRTIQALIDDGYTGYVDFRSSIDATLARARGDS